MNDSSENPPQQPEGPDEPQQPVEPAGNGGNDQLHMEQIRHAPIGARLGEGVAEGVFATGAIVLRGPNEFVIDFVQALARPPRLAARVIVTPQVMEQFAAALKDNIAKYENRFGPPKEIPKPDPKQRRPLKEVYADLKLPDDKLSGVYANTVMIAHSPGEFMFDFITRLFPNAAVSARVYVSASQTPRVLQTMDAALANYRSSQQQGPDQTQPPGESQ